MSPSFVLPLFAVLLLSWVLVPGTRPAEAWSPEGHKVVGAIAEELLDDATRAEVDRLLAVLATIDPDFRELPEACIWLDEVRNQGLGYFDSWHYINQPINPESLPVPPPDPHDVIFAIENSVATLRNPAASEFGRAFALGVLIHTLGDIHQPLHTVARFTRQHPQGDRGGNDFPLAAGQGRATNLHLLWDQGVGLLNVAASTNQEDAVRRLARDLSRGAAIENLPDLDDYDPHAWAEEGRRLALEVAYPGIEEGGHPSKEYVARAQPVVRRQLVLAGRRLAALLVSVLAPEPAAP